MLVYEISDPRLSGVFLTGVSVDRELAYANIYVSALEGSERASEVMEGFIHARGHIRKELAHRLELRTIPQLRVHWDTTPEQADKIERLFASLASPDDTENANILNVERDGPSDTHG